MKTSTRKTTRRQAASRDDVLVEASAKLRTLTDIESYAKIALDVLAETVKTDQRFFYHFIDGYLVIRQEWMPGYNFTPEIFQSGLEGTRPYEPADILKTGSSHKTVLELGFREFGHT